MTDVIVMLIVQWYLSWASDLVTVDGLALTAHQHQVSVKPLMIHSEQIILDFTLKDELHPDDGLSVRAKTSSAVTGQNSEWQEEKCNVYYVIDLDRMHS